MNRHARYAVFSVNSFVAAMAAAYIAISIGLPRPYWAMLTVYITSQPLTGALRSKAVYRVLGTTLGGVAAVAIVPTFVNSPLLMAVVMAGWTGGCLYLSLLDRTPRAYVFMLAGYTCAIIGFPSVNAPGAIFDTALARVEEITLGILCATIVHTIVLPQDVGRVLGGRIAMILRDGQHWITDALTGRPGADSADRRRMASDLTELHVTASHLPFDTAHLPLRANTMRALENRLVYMLPLISAIEDRLAELGPRSEAISALLADTCAWANADQDAPDQHSQAEVLIARAQALFPDMKEEGADWRRLLTVSILVRLQELIQTLQDGRDLARFTEAPTRPSGRVRELLRAPQRRRLHLDHGMAALSGLSLFTAVMICCGLWIFTAWPEGFVAAMMCAVFSSFFAAQDDPAPAILSFLIWTLLALPIAALYLFAILPAIDGFPMLCLALSPALLGIGFLMATPKWGPAGIAMLLGVVGGIAIQPTFAADMADFVNSNLAECVGVAVALCTARLMRSVGAGWAARRILRAGWRDVAALARGRRKEDVDSWISTMLDRVGLVNARIALAAPEDALDAYDALADMRVGLNLIDLHAAARNLDSEGRRRVDTTLWAVAATYEQRLKQPGPDHGRQTGGAALLNAIDHAIATLSAAAPGALEMRGFVALTGLRRNLYPHAAPYAPPEARAA